MGDITIIGTWPPLKGISPYCEALVSSLSRSAKINFISFRKIYPEFLYPGGTKHSGITDFSPKLNQVEVREIITYYNPLSWISAALAIKGNIFHVQWWAHVLAPIYFVILSIAKIRGKKIVITIHNVSAHENNVVTHLFNKAVLILGDRYIVHSISNKETLRKEYGIIEELIEVVPHGILEPMEYTNISKEDARAYLQIPQNKKVLLHFGTIRDYKGIDILLEAIAELKKNVPEIILLIAGKPWENWEKYEQIIKQNNLEAFVIKRLDFIPPNEIEYFYAASDLLILPYKYFNSQSGVGAQALAFRKPMIVTKVGGLPEYVRNEQAIAKPNDKTDLASKIAEILTNPQLYNELVKNMEAIRDEYAWDKIAQRTIEVYERALFDKNVVER